MNDGDQRPAATDGSSGAGLRTLIALTMLLVAALGAGIAGWAAIKQQTSAALERRLAQAQTMELAERLPLIDFSRSARGLQQRLDTHLTEAGRQRALADATRASDPGRARFHDISAQEETLKANVLRPFVEFLPNIINDDQTLDERRIGLVAAGSLQRRGFQAAWTEGNGAAGGTATPPAAHIDYFEKGRLEAFDEQVLELALVVVALVATLVLLTLADLGVRRRGLAVGLHFLAAIGAALCTGAAVYIDQALVRVVAGIAGAFAGLVVIAWLFGWLGRSTERDAPVQTVGIDQRGGIGDGALPAQETAPALSRHIVVWIALAALASAVIGYWYTVAGARGDDASFDAYEQQLEIGRRVGRGTTAVITGFESLARLYERRLACQAAASRTKVNVRDDAAGDAAPGAELDRKLHCDALATSRLSPADAALERLDHRLGADADPRFPLRLQQEIMASVPSADTAEALALWDGYTEMSAFWNDKTTSFLAGLTIIAIALYVLGQALAMEGLGVARALAVCGIAMTLGAFAWSSLTWLQPMSAAAVAAPAECPMPKAMAGQATAPSPEGRMQAAAYNYARGVLRLGGADSVADYASAIAALECAVAFRPSLSLAYNDLAGAKALSQSAHKAQAYYSLPTKDRLDDIERNARSAVDIQERLGLQPNAYSLNAHAVALWGLGIRDGKLTQIAQALDIVERAIAIAEPLEADRRNVSADAAKNLYPWLSILPLLHLNHSLFLIATDRLEEGRQAGERALSLEASRDWSLAAAMLTATSLLDNACERLYVGANARCRAIRAALADYRKALLEGRWPTSSPAPSGRIQGMGAVANPSTITLAVRLPTYDPAKDHLQMIWSVIDPQWGVRDVLGHVLPTVAATEIRQVKDRGIYIQRRIMQAGNYRRCLSGGRYAAEINLNGRLEASAMTEFKGPQLVASRLDRLNLAFCHPTGWALSRSEDAPEWDPTPMVGFVNSAGTPAAFLFSFMMPKPAEADVAGVDALAVDRALERIAQHRADGATAAILKGRLRPCGKAQPGDVAFAVARAATGLVHVALLEIDALEGANACHLMNTVTIMN